jgi:crossover junction endodeoxyribonuclease RuvC
VTSQELADEVTQAITSCRARVLGVGAEQYDDGSGTQKSALGIDQSYAGFALTAMALDGTGVFYTWCRRLQGFGVTRLQDAQYFVYSVLETLRAEARPVDRVGLEGYAYSSQVAHSAGELGAAVKLVLADYFGVAEKGPGYPLIIPTQIHKKFATGSGASKKNEMLLKVYRKWGVEFRDDNMADSYSIAQLMRYRDVEAGLAGYELDVLGKMRDPKHCEWSPVA